MNVPTLSAKAQPPLIICGPTATGKTNLALSFAQRFRGWLLSADSRQLYRQLTLGTGKDIPAQASLQTSSLTFRHRPISYYQLGEIQIWGYDLVDFWEPFSVADYVSLSWQLLSHFQAKKRLPIVVGGTGLFIKSLFFPPATMGIPPHPQFRSQLSQLPVSSLQARLHRLSPLNWQRLNPSDRANPRRLIRALEIHQYSSTNSDFFAAPPIIHPHWLGLTLPSSLLRSRIKDRVLTRANAAFSQEVRQLLNHPRYVSSLPSLTACGYQEWTAYLSGKIDQTTAIKLWILHEQQYAKRQITWFNKQPQIHWFDVSSTQTQSDVVDQVKSWYA